MQPDFSRYDLFNMLLRYDTEIHSYKITSSHLTIGDCRELMSNIQRLTNFIEPTLKYLIEHNFIISVQYPINCISSITWDSYETYINAVYFANDIKRNRIIISTAGVLNIKEEHLGLLYMALKFILRTYDGYYNQYGITHV